MKTGKISLLVLFSVSLLLHGCVSSDDFTFDFESLKQTNWGGTLVTTSFDEVLEYTAGLSFHTATAGAYDLLPATHEASAMKSSFMYSVDDQMLKIEGKTFLSGYWFITRHDKKNLVLEQGTGADIDTKVLTLKRK